MLHDNISSDMSNVFMHVSKTMLACMSSYAFINIVNTDRRDELCRENNFAA